MPAFSPHDLGKRVVVRHRTGGVGPSGGPEMTDVIGHLRAINDTAVTVERKNGERVTVRWADIAACKVV